MSVTRRLVAAFVVLGVGGYLVYFDAAHEHNFQLDRNSAIQQAVPVVFGDEHLTTSWFCPGVPANDGSITGSISIANSSDSDITGTVTLLSKDQAPVKTALLVPARSSVAVDAIGGIQSLFVSAVIELNGTAGTVEQHIEHLAGDSVALCANAPAQDWFFADGFTGADSVEQIVLTNPFTDATVVDISFVTLETKREPANLQGFVLPPQSVTVLAMDEQGARNEKVLAVAVRASSGRLIAGRSQHFLGDGRLGYTMSLGASATSPQWWFSNGEKSPDVSEQLVIFNPGSADRSLTIVFIASGDIAAAVEPATITAPAGRVVTLDTGKLPSLPDGRYGILVAISDIGVAAGMEATGSDATHALDGIVVEQVVNRRDGNTVATSVVLGMPASAASTTWFAPSGVTAGLEGAVVVLNTTANAASISVQSVGPAGAVALTGLESVAIPGSGMATITVPVGLPEGEIIFRATEPVIVQRLLSRGHDLSGRVAVHALPLVPMPSASTPLASTPLASTPPG